LLHDGLKEGAYHNLFALWQIVIRTRQYVMFVKEIEHQLGLIVGL